MRKPRKWLNCNSNTHVTFFDKNLIFKVNCLKMEFPLCQRNFSVWKTQNSKNLSFSLIFLNNCSIKLNMTSYDVCRWSVATSLHSTLICNIHCKYTQTISIHHKEQIYVERQTDRMAKLQMEITYTGEMSVDSPQVRLLLKQRI